MENNSNIIYTTNSIQNIDILSKLTSISLDELEEKTNTFQEFVLIVLTSEKFRNKIDENICKKCKNFQKFNENNCRCDLFFKKLNDSVSLVEKIKKFDLLNNENFLKEIECPFEFEIIINKKDDNKI